MNYIDLFHGIGGFALGAYWAGMKFDRHYCSDIEPYAQKLYAKRFHDSIQLGDITKIKTEDLPDGEWIISGGFPCQDISIAGKGAGLSGARSGLWFEYWRIIRDLRPRFAIMENVGALTFRGLDLVLGSLAEIGYNAEWQDIRASDMGAPHKRERIWIIAYPDAASVRCNDGSHHRERRYILCDENRDAEENQSKREGRRCRSWQTGDDVADTGCEHGEQRDTAGMETDTGQRTKGKLYAEPGSKRHRNISDTSSERLQGQEPESGEREYDRLFAERHTWDWSTEPDVDRLVNGLPGRVDRLKGLGNAIVPQIAQILFERIKPLCN